MKYFNFMLFLFSFAVFSVSVVQARESESGENNLPDWQKLMRLEVTRTPERENESKFSFRKLLENSRSVMMKNQEKKEASESAKPREVDQNKLREKISKSQQRACGLNIAAYQKSRLVERKQLISNCLKNNNSEVSACKPLLKQFEQDTKTKIEAIKLDCKALRDKVLGVNTNANLR